MGYFHTWLYGGKIDEAFVKLQLGSTITKVTIGGKILAK